jgi:kynurenine formamidase
LSFSESIDSSTWHLKIELNKFISHNEVRAVCVDIDNVWLSGASEFESEWVFEHLETSSVKWHVLRVWHASDKLIWNSVSGLISISEQDFSNFVINLTEAIGHILNILIIISCWDLVWLQSNILIFTKSTNKFSINYGLVKL